MASRRAARSLIAFLSALSFAIATAPAGADPSAADKETARSLLNAGDARRRAGNLAGALEAYRAADAIMGVPTTGIEVAKTEERLGMLVEARDIALRVARTPPSDREPRPFKSTRAAAEQLADTLSQRIPSVRVEVSGPASPTIRIDGAVVSSSAASLSYKVNPGKHVVSVEAPGYERAEVEVETHESETSNCHLRPLPLPEVAPAPAKQVPSVTLALEGTPKRPPSEGLSPFVYVGAGVALAGIAVGTAAGVTVLGTVSRANESCRDAGNGAACDEQLHTGHVLATAANVAFGVAAIGAVVGVYTFLHRGAPRPVEARKQELRWQVSVGPSEVGVIGNF